MKKSLLFIIVLAFAGLQLNAAPGADELLAKKKKKSADSELRVGLRTGVNFANMTIEDATPAPKGLVGFHFGAMAEYTLTDMFGVEAGLLYSRKGCKSEFEFSQDIMGMYYKITGDMKIKPAYLEIPINAIVKLDLDDKKIFFTAGPYIGLGIGGKITSDATLETNIPGMDLATLGYENTDEAIKFGSSDTVDLKGMDFGFKIGAGFEMMNFQIRAQYGLGLANLSTIDDPTLGSTTIKNKVFGISVAYMLGL